MLEKDPLYSAQTPTEPDADRNTETDIPISMTGFGPVDSFAYDT